MTVALTPSDRREYVLIAERDLPRDKQTRFFFRTLPYALRTELGIAFAAARRGGSGQVLFEAKEAAEVHARALRFSLVGAENIVDANGAPVPFEEELDHLAGQPFRVVAWSWLDRLQARDRDELGNEALNRQFLSPGDVRG